MAKRRVVSKTSYVDPDMVGKTTNLGHQGTVEAIWTCNSCGTENIPGGDKKCPQCGNPKDKSETYQPPTNIGKMLTPAELSGLGVDPKTHESDEECPYCTSKNKPGTEVCANCGGKLIDTARTPNICPRCGRETSLSICPGCGSDLATKVKAEPVQQRRQSTPQTVVTKYYINPLPIMITLAVITLFAILLYWLWPREANAEVSSVSWTSQIDLEEYQYNRHEGWTLPSGADKESSRLRYHHTDTIVVGQVNVCRTEQIQDGTKPQDYTEQVCEEVYSHTDVTCYDDGTCDVDNIGTQSCHPETRTRQVPKYVEKEFCDLVDVTKDVDVNRDYYTYSIWEWVNIPSATNAGDDLEPLWPKVVIDEKHRERRRFMTFTVVFEYDSSRFTYSPKDIDEFTRYHIGTEWKIKHSAGRVFEVAALE